MLQVFRVTLVAAVVALASTPSDYWTQARNHSAHPIQPVVPFARGRYAEAQAPVVMILRQIAMGQGSGKTLAEACAAAGVPEQA